MGGNLVSWKPGQSGNPGGRPKTKPLTDGMRMLLEGDKEGFLALPKPLRLQIARWYGDALTCAKSRALLLDRMEGGVPRAVDDKPLPVTEFILEVIGQPAPPKLNGEAVASNGSIEVEVERL